MGDSVLSIFSRYAELGDPALSTLSIILAVVLGGAILLWAKRSYTLYSCRRPDVVLPKGTLGWPIVGESLDFRRDPLQFAHSHVRRYGSMFKANIFLHPTICGTTPEFVKFVNGNPQLFRRAFPESFKRVLGPTTFAFQEGPPHLSVRKLVLKSIGPEGLRHQVHSFENIVLEHMASWARAATVVGCEAVQKLTWDASNCVLFGDKNISSSPQGRKNMKNFKMANGGVAAMPVNLPGTQFNKCMKARAELIAYFKSLIEPMTKGQMASEGVFFAALLAARNDPDGLEELKNLDDVKLAENMLLLNAGASNTTSSTLVWVLKYLIDYPEVFRRCQAEQQEILKTKDLSVEGPRLTWDDTKKMVYTLKFFQEVQRSLTILPVLFKEATEDVNFEGHLIPKGWRVIPLTNYIHTDPANYPDLNFNPDRFDVSPKPYTYLPFSVGPHMCPGIEMAKLIVCIFVHYLTTTYTYERVGPDQGMMYDEFCPKPIGGYPIKVSPRTG